MRKTCVVMAEGQQTLLKSMKNLLEPHVEVVAMPDNLLSMIDSIRSLDPDIAIIHAVDLHRDHGTSIQHLGRCFRDLTIIIVGDVDDPELIKSVMTRNVKGYVHLQDASSQLIPAVDAVIRGETFPSTPEFAVEDEYGNQQE